ncbi:MAG: hypothetical protein HZY76_02155 [Anaerolineae bacterium]|nr:MAG: hypothetical protein HZY76_02155 [Anaerolineae bacterium]
MAVGARLDEDIAPAQELGMRGAVQCAATPDQRPAGAAGAARRRNHILGRAWPLLAGWLTADARPDDDFWAAAAPLEPPPVPNDFDPETPAAA